MIYPFLSYKELRPSVLVSCESSISDFLNSTSFPWPPEQYCKPEKCKLGFLDQVLIYNKVTMLEEKNERIGSRILRRSFLYWYDQVGNGLKTGRSIPVSSQMMVHIWVWAPRASSWVKMFKKHFNMEGTNWTTEGWGAWESIGPRLRKNFNYCKVQHMEGLLGKYFSLHMSYKHQIPQQTKSQTWR